MKLDPEKLRIRTHLADGGWSTILRAQLPAPIPQSEQLNLSHPQIVSALARRFVEAGAEFVGTNTFATNRFAWRGSPDEAVHATRAGAALTRAAVKPNQAVVCGTIGPTTRILGVGEIPTTDAAAAFAECAATLAEAGVDAILLETFTELQEMLLAIEGVRSRTDLPIIASMSFDSGPQRTRTVMGAEASECAAALDAAGVAVLGCNCGAGVVHCLPAVVAMRVATQRPLWVKPSAGLPEIEQERTVYRVAPEEFAKACGELIEAGADIIGGCCGVGPEHIARLAKTMKRRRS